MTDFYLGIDPGLTGALGLVDDCGNGIIAADMPTDDGNVNPALLADLIDEIDSEFSPRITIIERVSARPGQGVSSMFKFGRSLGMIEGALGAFGMQTRYVTPQRWKRHFNLINKHKDASRLLCIDLMPEIAAELQRKKDHGRADALLLARYAASL